MVVTIPDDSLQVKCSLRCLTARIRYGPRTLEISHIVEAQVGPAPSLAASPQRESQLAR